MANNQRASRWWRGMGQRQVNPKSGVLLHITSLPAPHGIGDLGPQARQFADWAANTGCAAWQVLPINPIGEGNSPYSSRSAFAIEPLLMSLEDLHADGLLPRRALAADALLKSGPCRYAAARRFKAPRIHRAFASFASSGGLRQAAFQHFADAQSHWLEAWCDDQPGEPDELAFVQYKLNEQWLRLRKHAKKQGVSFIGDVPIFVHADSTDVRQHPHLFQLDARNRPTVVSGVPPDDFCRAGQRWGHPHYNWPAHRAEQFAWWVARFRRAIELFDTVRVDHFIGFVRLYEVSARAKTARRGNWRRTPGRALLEVLLRELGSLPLIAEDLGAVTPAVTKLRNDFDLPGMRIAQWGYGSDTSKDLPERFPTRCVCYPGTHDNDTIAGWYRALDQEARKRFQHATGCERAADAPASLIKACLRSPAEWCIIPMQDILGLGSTARMNRPGTPKNNWRWRMPPTTNCGLSLHRGQQQTH
ncbi:MAG: 4-alpha-glucanotransferase [Phycisphaerales bacterium]|nr:4-alpha-glucanotransferase [Phycisphaerales bacterium]